MRWFFAATAFASIGLPAQADLQLQFIEGAPKDRFVLTNLAECALQEAIVTIDMAASTGQLIFDVTDQGAGVEVFQPFDVVTGADLLAEPPTVTDGQTQVALHLLGMGAGDSLIITTDVDDTIGTREITVTGSEFAGTTLNVDLGGQQSQAVFQQTRDVIAPIDAC